MSALEKYILGGSFLGRYIVLSAKYRLGSKIGAGADRNRATHVAVLTDATIFLRAALQLTTIRRTHPQRLCALEVMGKMWRT